MNQAHAEIPRPLFDVLEAEHRDMIAAFFDDYTGPMRVLVDSVLSGFGVVRIDNDEAPTVVQLAQGYFTVFKGDSDSPVAKSMVEHTPSMFIVQPDENWRALLSGRHGSMMRSMKRISHTPEHLDRGHLAAIRAALPEGMEILRMDSALANWVALQYDHELVNGFLTPDEFAAHGIGYVVRNGEELIAGATSYLKSDKEITVALSVQHEYRRRGIGSAVAAALVEECLDRELYVNWDAANEAAANLGKKLGFVSRGEFELLIPGIPNV